MFGQLNGWLIPLHEFCLFNVILPPDSYGLCSALVQDSQKCYQIDGKNTRLEGLRVSELYGTEEYIW